jgi:hypothetical protein
VSARAAWLTVLGGILLAALGALGVSLSDGPRLTFDSLDPWLVVYALGLFVALGALPFGLHERFSARTEDRDRRWELALSAWGGLALLAGVAFLLLGIAAGFGSATASGALAVVGLAACALVVGGLVVLLVST